MVEPAKSSLRRLLLEPGEGGRWRGPRHHPLQGSRPRAPDEVPHPSGCGCVGCYYEELRTAAEPPGGTPGHGEKKVA